MTKLLFVWPHLLLHPNIPKPLHGMNPRTLKGQEWWDEQRQIAYAKNNYHCWACGVHKSQAKYHQWLEAHECYEIDYKRGFARMKLIVALCHACHNAIHDGRMQMMLQQGTMNAQKFHDIMKHSREVKARIDYNRWPRELLFLRKTYQRYLSATDSNSNMAPWHKWYLMLEGQKYKTRFPSFEAWKAHYANPKNR